MRIILAIILLFGIIYSASDTQIELSLAQKCLPTNETINLLTASSSSGPIEDAVVIIDDVDPLKRILSDKTNESGQLEFQGCEDSYEVRVIAPGFETKKVTYTLGSCTCSYAPPVVEEDAPEEPVTEDDVQEEPSEDTTETTEEQETENQPRENNNQKTEIREENEVSPLPERRKPLPCCISPLFVLLLGGFVIGKYYK